MARQLNTSSYYRANPYFKQGYLPDSAFNNRKIPTYVAELPMGNEYFSTGHKKHFTRIGYQSAITQQQLINSSQQYHSPAKDKEYFRNLNIQDIEGAVTNTLISQAVKNRMKAEQLAKREKQIQGLQESRRLVRRLYNEEDNTKRIEAIGKMKTDFHQENYHERAKRFKTQNYNSRDEPKYTNNKQQHYQSSNRFQLAQTEQEISWLEERLRNMRKQANRDRVNTEIVDAQQRYRQNEGILQQKKHLVLQNETVQYSNRQAIINRAKADNYSREKNQQNSINSMQSNYQFGCRGNKMKQQQRYSGLKEIHENNKKRSITQNIQPQTHQIYPSSTDAVIQPNKNEPNFSYLQQNKQRMYREKRAQHRRYNPTFLSSGTGTIGLAGKNIVGL